MAKGVEDTALYRDTRLVARNEVGGNLAVFGRPVAELHQANAEREARWPQSMLATSTHDTKRGEDVRARLAVLSECPARWWPLAARWTDPPGRRGRPRPTPCCCGRPWPAPGRWSRTRCLAYMEKAVREAGLHTTWTDPDPAYERAVAALVDRAYADPRSWPSWRPWSPRSPPPAGSRRPPWPSSASPAPASPTPTRAPRPSSWSWSTPTTAAPSPSRPTPPSSSRSPAPPSASAATTRSLFTGYRPLDAPDHLVAYTRGNDRLAVVVTRPHRRRGPRPAGPVDLPPGPWHDLLSGTDHPGGPTPADQLLAALPHALLVRA